MNEKAIDAALNAYLTDGTATPRDWVIAAIAAYQAVVGDANQSELTAAQARIQELEEQLTKIGGVSALNAAGIATGADAELIEMLLREAEENEAALSAAIGTNDYLDPPDGGGSGLIEQVRRMRADVLSLRTRLDAATEFARERGHRGTCSYFAACMECRRPFHSFVHHQGHDTPADHTFIPGHCNCGLTDLLEGKP